MDYIRKQDALKAIIGVLNDPDYEAHPLSEAYDRIANLPIYTPYQKKGTWIEENDPWTLDSIWKCSNCGEPFILIEGTPKQNGYNYCPNCGAEMLDVPGGCDGKCETAEFYAECDRESELLKREEGKT